MWCQWEDIQIVERHAMPVTTENEKCIEYNDGCMAISRHWVLVHLSKLRLAFQFELSIYRFHWTTYWHAICRLVRLSSFCKIIEWLAWFHRCEAKLIRLQTPLYISLFHFYKVVVKAWVLIFKDSCALQFDLCRTVFLVLIIEDAEKIKWFQLLDIRRHDASFSTRSRENAW